MKKIVFSENELKDIIYLYTNSHTSMRKIGEKYNVSKTVITRVLKENNVPINFDNHKYKADYRKFQNIDNSEKAYWLGFLAADGCNYQRKENASIIINIHQRDIRHLEKFQKFMNTDTKVISYIATEGFSNNTPMCKITLNSKEMSQDLSNLGIIPNKSLKLEPPKIKEEYYLPFILGYFDGDGSIYTTLCHSVKEFGISLVGTKNLLEWINSILEISSSLEQKNGVIRNNYYIRCGGTNKPYHILKKLYDSCEIHLDRKYKKFLSLETVVLSRNTK